MEFVLFLVLLFENNMIFPYKMKTLSLYGIVIASVISTHAAIKNMLSMIVYQQLLFSLIRCKLFLLNHHHNRKIIICHSSNPSQYKFYTHPSLI